MTFKTAVALLSITFIVLAPLVIFGYAARPLFYEPAVVQDAIQESNLLDPFIQVRGNDVISLSYKQAIESAIISSVPSILEYMRGDSNNPRIIVTADAIKAAMPASMRSILEKRLAMAPSCASGEQPTFVSMSSFTCSPASSQDKEKAVSIAISTASPFLNLGTMHDIDLSSVFSSLAQARNILKTSFSLLILFAIIASLSVLGIVAIKRDVGVAKILGIVFLWVGISTFVTSLILPSIVGGVVKELNDVVMPLFQIVIHNAQLMSIIFIVLGIVFIAAYFVLKSKR